MGKLSAGTIQTLQPIAEAIDNELEKEQQNRTNFLIQCASPGTMKNNLVLYKTLLRRDWNGKFWMSKKDNGVAIDFHPRRIANFTLQPIVQDETKRETFSIVTSGQDTAIAKELTDAEASHELLVENPSVMLLSIPHLSEETQNFLQDSKNADPSALIRLLQRRGYSWMVLGNKLKIHL